MSLSDDVSSLFPGYQYVERFAEPLDDDYEEEVWLNGLMLHKSSSQASPATDNLCDTRLGELRSSTYGRGD